METVLLLAGDGWQVEVGSGGSYGKRRHANLRMKERAGERLRDEIVYGPERCPGKPTSASLTADARQD